MPKPQPDRPVDVQVQRLRVRYAKRGRLRFVSHRDFQRALERALRRAEVPVAFSAGFSPHPKISYAGAAPTGAASEAEYLELGVTDREDPNALRISLDESLPTGLDVVTVVEATDAASTLPELLEASVWDMAFAEVATDDLASALKAFLAADEVQVERRTKKGTRQFDARGGVLSATVRTDPARSSVDAAEGCAILQVVVRHGTPAVRPDDVLAGIRASAGVGLPSPFEVTRCTQGPLDAATGEVLDPFAPYVGAPRGS